MVERLGVVGVATAHRAVERSSCVDRAGPADNSPPGTRPPGGPWRLPEPGPAAVLTDTRSGRRVKGHGPSALRPAPSLSDVPAAARGQRTGRWTHEPKAPTALRDNDCGSTHSPRHSALLHPPATPTRKPQALTSMPSGHSPRGHSLAGSAASLTVKPVHRQLPHRAGRWSVWLERCRCWRTMQLCWGPRGWPAPQLPGTGC